MIELEEIVINEEELELIEKSFFNKVPFPALSIGKDRIYFNTMAYKYIPEFIEWRTTPDYVVGLPAERRNKNAYRVQTRNGYTSARFPAKMSDEKKVQQGSYKLYKYKDGFCFKRYERIDKG